MVVSIVFSYQISFFQKQHKRLCQKLLRRSQTAREKAARTPPRARRGTGQNPAVGADAHKGMITRFAKRSGFAAIRNQMKTGNQRRHLPSGEKVAQGPHSMPSASTTSATDDANHYLKKHHSRCINALPRRPHLRCIAHIARRSSQFPSKFKQARSRPGFCTTPPPVGGVSIAAPLAQFQPPRIRSSVAARRGTRRSLMEKLVINRETRPP